MKNKNSLKFTGVLCLLAALVFSGKVSEDEIKTIEKPKEYETIVAKPKVVEQKVVKKEEPKPKVEAEVKVEAKPKVVMTTPAVEVNQYNPRWNVNGSWSAANNRNSLINHLSGSNHGYSRESLMAMSTDDLQRLHDSDHEGRTRSSSRTTSSSGYRRGLFGRRIYYR